jgi:hypothetical protein
VQRRVSAAARPTPASIRSRLAFVAAALLVTVTVVVAVLGTISLSGRSGTTGSPPAAPAPTEVAAPPTATQAPTDPRSVFRDPALRALAESFLAGPGVSCAQREPGTDAVESVACDLGQGRTGLFTRMRSAEAMREVRQDLLTGRTAEPGTVLSVRWRYADGRSGTRAGIPPSQGDRGEGVRARFVDLEGAPRLYFDQDSSGCSGELALTEPTGDDDADLEALRAFWESPAR